MKRAAKDPTYYAEARKWFAKAYKTDQNDAAALVSNYQSYDKAGAAIPESALIGLDRAYELAPYGQELRFLLMRQLLRENKLKSARVVIGPIAFSPHDSKIKEESEKIVVKIEEGNRAEALKIADDFIRKMDEDEDDK